MSPWSWFLLPTLCLLPASAAPRRGAPASASADCGLQPQVGRPAPAGGCPAPRGARPLPRPAKHLALGSRATSPGRAVSPARPAALRVPSPGGDPVPSPRPWGRRPEGRPGGVSWGSPACLAGVRGHRAEEPAKTRAVQGLWHVYFGSLFRPLFRALNFSCSYRDGKSALQLLDLTFLSSVPELERIWGELKPFPLFYRSGKLRLRAGPLGPTSRSAFAE